METTEYMVIHSGQFNFPWEKMEHFSYFDRQYHGYIISFGIAIFENSNKLDQYN